MTTIDDIINALDTEIDNLGIEYLSAPQANKLLAKKGLLPDSDNRPGLPLRNLLRDGLIPHAYQVGGRWRIPHSYEEAEINVYTPARPKKAQVNKTRPRVGIGWWIFSICLVVSFIAYIVKSTNKSSDNEDLVNNLTSNEYYNTPASNLDNNSEFKNFDGTRFTYKSTTNDKEFNGQIVQTNHETTYHTFDFKNRIVKCKSPINGRWLTETYPMNGFYVEKGILATTYVIVVGTLGVQEIWWSPDVPNLGYDFDDGSRIACYEITEIR